MTHRHGKKRQVVGLPEDVPDGRLELVETFAAINTLEIRTGNLRQDARRCSQFGQEFDGLRVQRLNRVRQRLSRGDALVLQDGAAVRSYFGG